LTTWGISLPEEKPVRLTTMWRWVVGMVPALWMMAAGAVLLRPAPAVAYDQSQDQAQQQPQEQPHEQPSEELSRKVRIKVEPVYPDVARRMSIAGTVRLAVVVAPNGRVMSSKPVGGHPVLVNAAVEAMKHWKFEPAQTESSGIVEFKFQPQP
jgi:TonB family protein